jgi:FkbH-like protein
MFEPEFADLRNWSRQSASPLEWRSRLQRSNVRRVQLLYWQEHCLECAPPECYHSCPLYIARQDKRCARFEYGIYPNQSIGGLLPYGAEIKFRQWGKLGTTLYKGGLSPTLHNVVSRFDRAGSAVVSLVYRILNPINLVDVLKIKRPNPQRIGYKIYAYVREVALRALSAPAESGGRYDVFVMECYSFEHDAFNMVLEYKESEVKSRHAIEIKKGHNYREIGIDEFHGTTHPLRGTLNLYPENDKEVRVAFAWLDFVQKQNNSRSDERDRSAKPAEKVKCVVWDLDNTLWEGILIEDGKNKLHLREEAVQLIHALDQRGIIQSVVSKNDHSEAMEVLAQFGLKEYFVYPMINWNPKSANLKRLATSLNINADNLGLIDDSPFERAEVKAVLPQMRVYSGEELSKLLEYAEFDTPITEESKVRRKSYLAEMEREQSFKDSGEDYEEFLRGCRMEMRIFIPREEAQIARCLELIQRSNQLNLSTKRYSESVLTELLGTDGMLCVGFQCKDRFGDYGIVGFASVDEASSEPRLVDLVISCRVAQKMVERTLIEWLVEREQSKGHRILDAELAKTKRNGPLRSVFESLPFSIIEENETTVRMRLPVERMAKKTDIIKTIIDL